MGGGEGFRVFALLVCTYRVGDHNGSPGEIVRDQRRFGVLFSVPVIRIGGSLRFLFALFFFCICCFYCGCFGSGACYYGCAGDVLARVFFIYFGSVLLSPILYWDWR